MLGKTTWAMRMYTQNHMQILPDRENYHRDRQYVSHNACSDADDAMKEVVNVSNHASLCLFSLKELLSYTLYSMSGKRRCTVKSESRKQYQEQ